MHPAALAVIALGMLPAASFAAGDSERGARVFRQCLACHSLAPGEHLTGPSLAHVFGRRAAGAADFRRYSDALKRSALVWNEATLDRWLADPQATVPGTTMTFPGIREAKQREDVIAYLHAVSGRGTAPAGRRQADLKTAPPQGQVIAVTHCGDTYAISTADGQTQKIWEYNLRLKTDSSRHGPAPGKPVVIGAGMQGDRASLVFASPGEISAFIGDSCP